MKKRLLVVTGICAAVGSMIAARYVSYASKDTKEVLYVEVLEEYETTEEIETLTETILQTPNSDLTENGKTEKKESNSKSEGSSYSTEAPVEKDAPKTEEETQADPVTTEATTEQANDFSPKGDDEPTTEEPVVEAVKVWVPAEYERVWVVYVPSWTEEIPVYEEYEAAECVKCHAILYSQAEVEAHGDLPACEPLQYRNYVYTVQTGTMSIFHEEEGHYEQRLVREGHYE